MSSSCLTRNRSRSPMPRADALVRMRGQLDFVHSTVPVESSAFLRTWMRCLVVGPTQCEGRQYFPLVKEHDSWPGCMWLRMEDPHALHLRGSIYAVDFSLWHGEELLTAMQQPLLRGSANQKRALTFCWPKVHRGQGRVVVSRIIGMSLLFDPQRWAEHGYGRFHPKLHVHHVDGIHENCFLNNLCVVLGKDHIGDHNHRRRRP